MGLFGNKNNNNQNNVSPELQELMKQFSNLQDDNSDPFGEEVVDEPFANGVKSGEVTAQHIEDNSKTYETTPEETEQIEDFLTGKQPEKVEEKIEEPTEEVVDEDTEDNAEIVEEKPEEEIVEEPTEEVVEDGDEILDEDELEDTDEILDDEVEEPTEAITEPEKETEESLSPEEQEFYNTLLARYGSKKQAAEEPTDVTEPEEVEEPEEDEIVQPDDDVEEPEEVVEPKPVKKVPAKKPATQKAKTTTKKATTTRAKKTTTETKKPARKRKVAVVPDLSVYETTDDVQVINGEEFYGQVITFMALDNIKQATWEDVVRRKGHVDYHMTSALNGGWFIKRSGVPNPYAYAKRKDEALKLARIYAEREKAELKVHNEKGIIEKSYSYGREKLRG